MPFQFRKEAIEEDLNSNFPSQGQGNPPLYYSLSEVVVPTYSINSVTEGSGLPETLQTAWDFSTGADRIITTSPTTIINNPGFWLVDLTAPLFTDGNTLFLTWKLEITDGITAKPVWAYTTSKNATVTRTTMQENKFVVFLRSGDSLTGTVPSADWPIDVWYRQIATVNGTLVNPLGYSAA